MIFTLPIEDLSWDGTVVVAGLFSNGSAGSNTICQVIRAMS